MRKLFITMMMIFSIAPTVLAGDVILNLEWSPKNSSEFVSYMIRIEDENDNFQEISTPIKKMKLDLVAGMTYEITIYGIDPSGNQLQLTIMLWSASESITIE